MTTESDNARRLPRHKVIKALYECYNEMKSYAEMGDGDFFITYQGLSICYIDLQDQLWRVSPRKREAMQLHLIEGYRQNETAELMNISPVTVGQYCTAGCSTIADWMFQDLPPEELGEEVDTSGHLISEAN